MEKNKKIRMSPAARKLAKQMGINVGELQADGIIRAKDIISAKAENEAYNNEILADYEKAVMVTAVDLTDRYAGVLAEQRKASAAAAWKDSKELQDKMTCEYLNECREKEACRKARERCACAKKAWQKAAGEQSYALNEFLAGKTRETRREEAAKAWKTAKELQTKRTNEYFMAVADEKAKANALARQTAAKKAWEEAKKLQSAQTAQFLAEYNAQKRKDESYANWKALKALQTKQTEAFLSEMYEEKVDKNRADRMNAAKKAWAAAKEVQTQRTNEYLMAVEAEKSRANALARQAAAREAWEEAKKEGDERIAYYVQQREEIAYENAYNEYVASLDEFNQVSVGKLEFDIDVIEDAIEESELSLNDAVTRYVASAVAKSLVDLECPIYENGVMNVISLTGANPIKTVKDAHEGEFTKLVYEDAVYFSKDIKVRIWDISVCGLESFFASQGGINVYINIDDDEVDLDVSIDTSVMMDLEALIFLMRMKEYLSGCEDEEDEDEE